MPLYDVTSKAKGERAFAHEDGFATIEPGKTLPALSLNEAQVTALMLTREFVLSAIAEEPAPEADKPKAAKA